MDVNKKVILTGLRANNDLHIGHYFGAMKPIVDLALSKSAQYQVNLFVPDLHSFTTPIDHSKLHEQVMQNLHVFVAAGLPLDKDNIYIYRQSYVPAHSELAIILSSFTGFGEMSRMTQFKEKSATIRHDRVSVGLFSYPILMAADILLYGATFVPVGDDQSQHLEFTRDIAERMNKQFGPLFVVPEPVTKQHEFFGKDQGLRIKDLADPRKKMSKSDETGKGVLFLTDTPAVARQKIMGATTDSLGLIKYNHDEQPGVSNMMDILALLRDISIDQVRSEFEGQKQYGSLKEALSDSITKFLSNFRKRLMDVDEHDILYKLKGSESQMNEVAEVTLLKVQKAVGLR